MLVITGEMGSGKSSVLAGILDEMHHLEGEIHICGERYAGAVPPKGSASTGERAGQRHSHHQRQPAAAIHTSTSPLCTPLIGYCGQRAWLCQGSIRDNILLGRPFDETRYTRVLHAVALDVDMREWPHGDRAEVGGLRIDEA
jgi:ABC-type cobalamin/Fe3+-siderophores transport system ATPase subunit